MTNTQEILEPPDSPSTPELVEGASEYKGVQAGDLFKENPELSTVLNKIFKDTGVLYNRLEAYRNARREYGTSVEDRDAALKHFIEAKDAIHLKKYNAITLAVLLFKVIELIEGGERTVENSPRGFWRWFGSGGAATDKLKEVLPQYYNMAKILEAALAYRFEKHMTRGDKLTSEEAEKRQSDITEAADPDNDTLTLGINFTGKEKARDIWHLIARAALEGEGGNQGIYRNYIQTWKENHPTEHLGGALDTTICYLTYLRNTQKARLTLKEQLKGLIGAIEDSSKNAADMRTVNY